MKLAGQSSGLKFRVYSQAMTVIADFELGGQRSPGWHGVELPQALENNGLLYVQACSLEEGAFRISPAKVLVLR